MTAAFDSVAAVYDDLWTNTLVGQLQRATFWRHTGPLLNPGQTVLDLGCGTGEDADILRRRGIHVVAIDSSPEMVRIARERGIDAQVLRIENVNQVAPQKEIRFDSCISNFGALNCVQQLSESREPLARLIKPGGYLAVCMIGRFCLWETLWYALQGEFRKAVRRWSGESSSSLGAVVYYPRTDQIQSALAPAFRLVSTTGIGVCVPPSYVRMLSPKTLLRLDGIDRLIAGWRGIRALSDHRLLIFRRS